MTNNGATSQHNAEDRQRFEEATIGALLLAGPLLQREIVGSVEVEDFADPRCRLILSLVTEMLDSGVPVDPVTLFGFVNTKASLQVGPPRNGLVLFIYELVATVPVPISGPWYAAQVVEQSARQRVWFAGERLCRVAFAAGLVELRPIVADILAGAVEAVVRAEKVAI